MDRSILNIIFDCQIFKTKSQKKTTEFKNNIMRGRGHENWGHVRENSIAQVTKKSTTEITAWCPNYDNRK